jgi:D-3-phosphoglycerate dehydrogenase
MKKIKLLVADNIAEEGVDALAQNPAFDVVRAPGLGEADLCAQIADCEAVVVRSATRITATVIAAAARLRVIGRAGIGVDNIDVDAATERGIVVLNTPDANATTTAELAIAHLLSLSRHLPQADRSMRAGQWQRTKFVGSEVCGKTAGVVGFGTIGRIVASRCLGLQMRVLAYDPFVTPEAMRERGVEATDLDGLLAAADYVTLHCPLIDKTRNLISAERIASMKPGARLINCARGGLVDEAALYQALKTGQLAGAALDVYATEPPKGSPLLELDNIEFTPHLGASTEEAQVAVGVAIARQVAAFLVQGEAINAVNLPHVPAEELNKLRPYLSLAHRLGRLLAVLAPSPMQQIEISLHGRAADLDARPVAAEALVGFLSEQLTGPVNSVNARHIARARGITMVEARSAESAQFLSLVSVVGSYTGGQTLVAGTLLADRYPRLVRIDEHEIETIPEGTILITRHDDRPGVVGALGNLLGEEQVNISRMQVGASTSASEAMAVIGISRSLSPELLRKIEEIPAILRVYQVVF